MTGRLDELSRPNTFEIDLDAIATNVFEIRRFVGAGVQLFAAMKANAYGFGLLEVAPILQEVGVDVLAVADLADAQQLRAHAIAIPVLLYAGNFVDPAFVRKVQDLDLIPTVTDIEVARIYSSAADRDLKVFAKIDVGLERLGIPIDGASGVLREVLALPRLKLAGIYTHLNVPRGPEGPEYVRWQISRFAALVEEVRGWGLKIPVAMAASTPVLPIVGTGGFTAIDVGRIIYGSLRSDQDDIGTMTIRNAFRSLRSRLIHCKTISREKYVEYAPFPMRPGMRIGIAPIGYSDGIESANCGFALVRGRQAPLLAAPSLEHTRLDLTDIPDAQVGDEVVFVGSQDGLRITPDDVMQHLGMDQPTRMAASIRTSVRRVYTRSAS